MDAEAIKTVQTVAAFGFRVELGTIDDYIAVIASHIHRNRQIVIFTHNLHSLYLYYSSRRVRHLYSKALVMIDGMPIVWLMRLTGYRARIEHRVTWVDFFWPLMEEANRQHWKVFCIGSTEPVISLMVDAVRQKMPTIKLEGCHGHFEIGRTFERALIRKIEEFGPDLCLVGMGTPRQEEWALTCPGLGEVPAILTCGACFEYIAGAVRTPPRWIGRIGLEWSFRLAENPVRFAHRYLLEPWLLLGLWIRLVVSKR